MRHLGGLGALGLALALAVPSLGAQETHVVLVTGLGGDPAYTESFQAWAGAIRQAALENGVPAERITWLGEDPAAMPGVIAARSTKEALGSALAGVAEAAGPDDRVLLVFIGHGTSRGDESRFNLPGPDLTGADLDALLDTFGAGGDGSAAAGGPTVAVVNTAPASGPWVAELSAPDRIVVTATASAREQNETRFGAFFSEAFRDDEADLDRNGRVSLLEAFTYARAELARTYEEQNLLLTEHALLDDDGDGEGAREPATLAAGPDQATSDGALAARFWLGSAGGAATAAGADGADVPDVDDPELRRLYEERARLEGLVTELRGRRGEMETEAYESALEALLLEIAAVSRQIREIEGGGR